MRLRDVWRVSVVLVAGAALVGCTSLDAVTSASGKLLTASKSWGAVADEFNASCVRQQQFNPHLTDCKDPAAASAAMASANMLLTSYFQALGDAASDQNFTVQGGLGALATSVQGIPGADSSQVAAASDLAKLFNTWALMAVREKALRHLIEGGVGPSKKVIEAMDQYVTGSLAIVLKQERLTLDGRYLDYLYPAGGKTTADLRAMCGARPRAYDFHDGATFLVAVDYCRRSADLDAKVASVSAYDQSLKTAESTLDALASSKSQLSSKALISQLYSMGKALDADVEAVNKAFSQGAAS